MGRRLTVTTTSQARNGSIVLATDTALGRLGDEGYELIVSSHSIVARAAKPAGLFYAVQTLRQLLPVETLQSRAVAKNAWAVPAVTVEDQPRYPWRGIMLDPAIKFFLPMDTLLRYIDLLAFHKMNRLHLHLTDATNWTIEIKKYPQLTQREKTQRPARCYGQDDIRRIVAYAAARHIVVVPEIEMPSHATAAIRALPALGCVGDSTLQDMCAGSDKTYEILENILTEVMDLFPSPFIHVGGDEYFGVSWTKCPHCQKRLKEENLDSQDTERLRNLFAKCAGDKKKYLLYRYMMRRVCHFVVSKGRQPILWDDLSWQGQFPEGAIIEQWHFKGGNDAFACTATPENPAVEAARAGHDVLVSPFSHLYFDYSGAWRHVYDLEPTPADISADQGCRILGPHAAVWFREPDKLDVELFPRLCALAEIGWTSKANKNSGDFAKRLRAHRLRAKALGVHLIYDGPKDNDCPWRG